MYHRTDTEGAKEANEFNREQLSSFMKTHGIKHVWMYFDGSGDSGQIEEVEFNGDQKLLTEKIKVKAKNYKFVDNKVQYTIDDEEWTFERLLEEVGYIALEENYGGWEINEGSYGDIHIYDTGKGKIEFNERVMEVNVKEFEF